jgi:hypothetical protein
VYIFFELKHIPVKFEVLTAMVMKHSIFWDITLCGLFEVSLLSTYFHACFFRRLFFDPEDGSDMFLRNFG